MLFQNLKFIDFYSEIQKLNLLYLNLGFVTVGTVLHQRGRLPYSITTMALVGFAITGAIWYGTMYAMKKPEATAVDVAKVATGVAGPEDTRPRK